MNKERLLKLAEVLETDSHGRILTVPGNGKVEFDMGLVLWTDRDPKEHKCGTSACAMGYAALHPWFIKRGLYAVGENVKVKGRTVCSSFDAAEYFFSISSHQSSELFGGHNGNETPKQVAKRIRKFVADHA